MSRRSIVTRHSCLAGEVIEEKDISFKRPQNTIPASAVHQIFGRKLKRSVPADYFLAWNDLLAH